MQGTLVFIVSAFILYFFVVLRPTGLLTANSLFVYIQVIMAIGIFRLLDPTVAADVRHELILAWCITSYMVVSGLATLHRPSKLTAGRVGTPPAVIVLRPNFVIIALVLLSVAVMVAYFSAIGYSAFVRGLLNSISGGTADIAGQRLAGYSGNRYLFPGYVNQFKNALLPALTLLIVTYWTRSRSAHPFLTIALVGVTLFGLVGTGQRGAFVQFALTTIIFLYLMNGGRFPRGILKLALGAATVLIFSTIALGRSNSLLASNASLVARATAAAREIGGRIFEDQQIAAVFGFRYVFAQPVQAGAEWLQALAGVLPGRGGSRVGNEIYSILYGSDRGTAPLSVWGSVYHNFGWIGIALVPAILAVVFVTISRRGTQRRERTTLELIGIAGTFTTIGLWASGSPDFLLNSGLVVYAALWLWGRSTLGGTGETPLTGPGSLIAHLVLIQPPRKAEQEQVIRSRLSFAPNRPQTIDHD